MLPTVKMMKGSRGKFISACLSGADLNVYDPNGYLSNLPAETCNSVYYEYVPRTEPCYAWWDGGTNFFGSTFEIKFEINTESVLLYGSCSLMALSNVPQQSRLEMENDDEGFTLRTNRNLNKVLWRLTDYSTGDYTSRYSVQSFSTNTPHLWCNLIRKPANQLTMQWWEDADRTIQYITPTTLTVDAFDKFRYMYPFQSYNAAGGDTDYVLGYFYDNMEVIVPAP